MGDDPIVISSAQVVTPESVMSRNFPTALRGYHPAEVRQFLKRVSDELVAGAAREAGLRQDLQEALERAAHPDIDEATVTNALGDHAERVLADARGTAASMLAEADARSHALIRDAKAHTAQVHQEAESVLARRVAEAEAATEGMQHTAAVEADAIREQAQADADAVVEAARVEGREMVIEARALRERMLGDLTRRRRAAQLQVEQLRAARDRLLSAYEVVRRTLDEATAELVAAEPEVRLAAEAVAHRAEEAAAEPDTGAREEPSDPDAGGAGAGPERFPEPRQSTAPTGSGRAPMRPQGVAEAAAGRRAPHPSPPTKVEELFTRLRAERLQAPVLRTATPDTAAVAEAPAPAPFPGPPVLRPPESSAGPDPVASESALTGRDALLDGVEAGLSRALKRVLQDEQNTVLDNLRRLGVSGSVLPDPEAHLATYRNAALRWLEQAARSGARFASQAPPGQDPEAPGPPVDAQAQALAAELVEPLRERLQRALADTAGSDDHAVAGESLRAVYRRWKAPQMDDVARHHAAAAFSSGAFGATQDGAAVVWLVEDDGHCADCDDNALAGPTEKGQPFPTGQLYPPAHRGCRCVLLPAST